MITDIKMPGVSGQEVCFEIKKIKGGRTPVIGMSGTPWLIKNRSFDGMIAKPFAIKDLLDTVNSTIQGFT